MRTKMRITSILLPWSLSCRMLLVIGLLISSSLELRSQTAEDIQALQSLEETIKDTETLLSKYPGNDFAPNLMFQLSELYIKRATLRFQREMLLYEEAERKFAAGKLAKEPVAPQIDFHDAIEISEQIIEKFPTAHFRDKVLYRAALCLSEQGKRDEAVKYYELLAAETGEKQLLEEAYFRLGEYHFDKEDYQKTIEYYGRLLNSWDSPFFGMALYKLGWSYYNIENYTKAIGTFTYLIEDIDLLDEAGSNDLTHSKADLRRESIEYVAICFSEFGGPAKARDFLLPKKDSDYAEEVLVHLAKLYRSRNFYADAIATLQMLIEFYPDKVDAGLYQKQIVENYDLASEKEKADIERAKFVDSYGPGSKWLASIPESEKRAEIVSTTEEYLYQLGSEAQQRAQKGSDALDYELAIGHYKSYLEKFPRSERANKVQFYLGEAYYDLKKYADAANAYYELHLNYPESEYSETAAYNRILAYNHLLQVNTHTDSTDFFLFNFLGENKAVVEVFKAKNGNQAQLMQASNDFYAFHPESPRANQVLMNLGQMLFDLGQLKLAEQVYQELLARPAGNPYLAQATYMMAQAEFQQSNFAKSEEWYRKVKEEFPDSASYVSRANKMISSSQFKRAENHIGAGDSLSAAQEFERVASSAPDTAIAERALFESARFYETLGNKEKAISLYEQLIDKFPSSELIDDGLFKAARLSEDLSDWLRAATNYLRLYRFDRFSDFAPRALFSAAKCYENIERPDLARDYYQEYIDAYIQDPDRYIEAAFRRGELAYNQGMVKEALKDFSFVLTAYERFLKEGISVEDYIPANAQFLIGEIKFAAFEKIELTPPLQRKLKRKQTNFQEVIKSYAAAAKFKIAEWSTASSFKIGRTFESFADALLGSERPKNLSAEQLDKYNAELWERVLPFKKKALETYEANLKNAEENGIENDWTTQTKHRIENLHTELGMTSIAERKQGDS